MLAGLYDASGFSKVIENLASTLGERGIDVTIGTLSFKARAKQTEFLDSFDIVHNHHPLTNYFSLISQTPFIYHYGARGMID